MRRSSSLASHTTRMRRQCRPPSWARTTSLAACTSEALQCLRGARAGLRAGAIRDRLCVDVLSRRGPPPAAALPECVYIRIPLTNACARFPPNPGSTCTRAELVRSGPGTTTFRTRTLLRPCTRDSKKVSRAPDYRIRGWHLWLHSFSRVCGREGVAEHLRENECGPEQVRLVRTSPALGYLTDDRAHVHVVV